MARQGLERSQLAGESALAAVGRIAMDRAAFDRAIQLGAEGAGLGGGSGFVLRREGGAGFFRERLEGVQGAAVARGADYGLTCTLGGGFDVGHGKCVVDVVPEGRIELPTKGL